MYTRLTYGRFPIPLTFVSFTGIVQKEANCVPCPDPEASNRGKSSVLNLIHRRVPLEKVVATLSTEGFSVEKVGLYNRKIYLRKLTTGEECWFDLNLNLKT